MKYTVRYYKRNPLDPQDKYAIQRANVNASTPQEAHAIMEECDCEVIDVAECEEDVSINTSAAPLCSHATPEQIAYTLEMDKAVDDGYEKGAECIYPECDKGHYPLGEQEHFDDDGTPLGSEFIWGACPCCGGCNWQDCPNCKTAVNTSASPLNLTARYFTSITPSVEELDNRSYNRRIVPGHNCPRCGITLAVNEKTDKTVNPDRPFYTRRLTCPNYFVDGCEYKEKWSEAIRDLLCAESVRLEAQEVEF